MKNLAIPIKIGTLTEKVQSLSFHPEPLNGSIDFTVSPAKKIQPLYAIPPFLLEPFNEEFAEHITKNCLQKYSNKDISAILWIILLLLTASQRQLCAILKYYCI